MNQSVRRTVLDVCMYIYIYVCLSVFSPCVVSANCQQRLFPFFDHIEDKAGMFPLFRGENIINPETNARDTVIVRFHVDVHRAVRGIEDEIRGRVVVIGPRDRRVACKESVSVSSSPFV